jgi:prevent-host-death family protein
MTMDKTIAAGEFKAKCLHLLDEVAQQRTPLVITKRGKPIAKLVPREDRPVQLFGRMKGTVKILGDVIGPMEDALWTADEENVLGNRT